MTQSSLSNNLSSRSIGYDVDSDYTERLTEVDDYVGWKGGIRQIDSQSSLTGGGGAAVNDNDNASYNSSDNGSFHNGQLCETHGRANCPGCNRARIRRRKNQQYENRVRHESTTSVTLNSLRSSASVPTRRKLSYYRKYNNNNNDDDPAVSYCESDNVHVEMDPEFDSVHAKAAEALIRVIEMKELDLGHVLSKLESYDQKSRQQQQQQHGRNKENRSIQKLYTPIDADNYVSDEEDDENQSVMSEMSTVSANHRRIARNTAKLASHIMHTPQNKFEGKKGVALKDDPEFSLYFRMLRYGFTIGAVRAALQRDGKPDITRLDPDKPVHLQRLPRVLGTHDEERMSESTAGISRPDSMMARGSSIEIQGLEFNDEGLTDLGWETALESARKSDPQSAEQNSSLGGVKTPAYRNRPNGLATPTMPTPTMGRAASESSASMKSMKSLPPWLQSNAERGMIEGWLRKRTRRGRWVRRWYLLDSSGIYYSHIPPTSSGISISAMGKTNSKKFVKLIDARTLGAKICRLRPNEFEIWHPSQNKPIASLRATSMAEAQQWVDAIGTACERLRLVDEVVVGNMVPEELVRNTIGRIEELEQQTQDSYRTPTPNHLKKERYSKGSEQLQTIRSESMDHEDDELIQPMGGDGLLSRESMEKLDELIGGEGGTLLEGGGEGYYGLGDGLGPGLGEGYGDGLGPGLGGEGYGDGLGPGLGDGMGPGLGE